ncbi:MAG: fused MFS/spermidine synthase [Saprospiraceae bacterium]|nr:fused MFS/spermidine synthase [Saprospiraceae bacterium]
MKFPINSLTKLVSYLVPLPVNRSRSHLDQPLFVNLVKGRLQLSTLKAVYSFDDKYDNFETALKVINPRKYTKGGFLILGGGLGSIPYIIERNYHLMLNFTMVEIDISVIHLFNQFTKPRLKSSFDLRLVDAESFMTNNKDKFKVVVIDLFVDDVIPDKFRTTEFLKQCRDALLPDGVLMFNWMTVTKEEKHLFEQYKADFFEKVFPRSKTVKTRYNHVLIGFV